MKKAVDVSRQQKFNEQVGGTAYDNTDATSSGTAAALLTQQHIMLMLWLT